MFGPPRPYLLLDFFIPLFIGMGLARKDYEYHRVMGACPQRQIAVIQISCNHDSRGEGHGNMLVMGYVI